MKHFCGYNKWGQVALKLMVLWLVIIRSVAFCKLVDRMNDQRTSYSVENKPLSE